jgi:hypothetical protein
MVQTYPLGNVARRPARDSQRFLASIRGKVVDLPLQFPTFGDVFRGIPDSRFER